MTARNKSKINQVFTEWPHETVVTLKWLADRGVSRFLARSYVKGDWIKPIGPGAFVKADTKPLWSGGLHALQDQLKLQVHAGGETALRWHGYGHNVLMSSLPTAYLFAPQGTKLPSWFLKYKWANKIQFKTTDFLPYKKDFGFTVDRQTGIILSSPERAILETLLLMPEHTTFDGAAHWMEGLTTLRPELVSALLRACRSVKVKRCFLYLADQSNHVWFERLDLSNVDLGKGKRVVVSGGVFNQKYQITVPHTHTG